MSVRLNIIFGVQRFAGVQLAVSYTHLIVIGQIKDFMGLAFEKAPVETMEKLEQVITCFGTLNVQALACLLYTSRCV